jgi:hypothetical protein
MKEGRAAFRDLLGRIEAHLRTSGGEARLPELQEFWKAAASPDHADTLASLSAPLVTSRLVPVLGDGLQAGQRPTHGPGGSGVVFRVPPRQTRYLPLATFWSGGGCHVPSPAGRIEGGSVFGQ